MFVCRPRSSAMSTVAVLRPSRDQLHHNTGTTAALPWMADTYSGEDCWQDVLRAEHLPLPSPQESCLLSSGLQWNNKMNNSDIYSSWRHQRVKCRTSRLEDYFFLLPSGLWTAYRSLEAWLAHTTILTVNTPNLHIQLVLCYSSFAHLIFFLMQISVFSDC